MYDGKTLICFNTDLYLIKRYKQRERFYYKRLTRYGVGQDEKL